MKISSQTLVVLALLATAPVSQATPPSPPTLVAAWGNNPIVVSTAHEVSGPFNEMFTFSLSGSNVSTFSTIGMSFSYQSVNYVDIVNGSFQLFTNGVDGTAGTADDVAASVATPFTGSTTGTLRTTLAKDAYNLRVSGNGNGLLGGKYYITSSFVATPVPEPETWAMLVAGLAAVGFVARRRSS